MATINQFAYRRKELKKPRHSSEDMKLLLEIVRFLNSQFTTCNFNVFKKIRPFELRWTFDAKWYIVCNNPYIWNDDKALKQLKLDIAEMELPAFNWAFHIDAAVWDALGNTAFKLH